MKGTAWAECRVCGEKPEHEYAGGGEDLWHGLSVAQLLHEKGGSSVGACMNVEVSP